MAGVVVIGGGIAGLGTALALSRVGQQTVTVLERDAAPLPDDPEEAFGRWPRRGAPQVRHSHAFLARLHNLLRDRAPDVLAGLRAAGATDLSFTDPLPATLDDRSPQPGDEQLVALACRRTTFEWVLRKAVLAQSGVRFVDGAAVAGIAFDGDRATGVRLEDGTTIGGELVVDASGRRSGLPRWLAEAQRRPLDEVTDDCGVVYCTRFYRLRSRADAPAQAGITFGDSGYVKFAVFPGDGGAFSVTFAISSDDEALRALTSPRAFDAAVACFPALQAWVDRADPLTGVETMAGLVNRRRRLVVDGEPVVNGMVTVGDAAVCTNPLYGRGCSLAMVHAYALADLLATTGSAAAPGTPEMAIAFDAVTRTELEPWYEAALMQDRATRRRPRPAEPAGAATSPPDADDMAASLLRDGVMAATRTDAKVYRAFLRTLNLLDPPAAMMQDPDIVARVMAVWQDRENRPRPERVAPRRAEFIAAIADAA